LPRIRQHPRPSILQAFLVLTMGTGPALAYIDPGTGSIILQAIAGGVIAVSLFWRRLVHRVKGFFKPSAPDHREHPQRSDKEPPG
jgi:hypothetical protein